MQDLIKVLAALNEEMKWVAFRDEGAEVGLQCAVNIVEDMIVEAGLADPANAAILADAGHSA